MKSMTRAFLECAILLALVLAFAGCATTGASENGEEAVSAEDAAQAALGPDGEWTPEQEYYLGRAVAAQVLSKYPAYDAPEVNAYLNKLGQTLALVSDMPETFNGYHFLALDSEEINAFGAPGGFILITRGMLRCASSEEEVAAILAHEIGHVTGKDGVNAIEASRKKDIAAATYGPWLKAGVQAGADVAVHRGTSALLRPLTSRLPGFAGNAVENAAADAIKEGLKKSVEAFSASITDVVGTLVVAGYSREQEKQADLAAVTILHRMGYDPMALVRMLQVMKTRLKPGGLDFAKTHPDPSVRMGYVKGAVDALTPLPTAAKASKPAAVSKRQARYKAALAKI
jgi:beta-barrel assembly-enhancing protease